MATQFPESPQLIHSTESEIEHIYDHVKIRGGNNIYGKCSSPRGIAIDPNTNYMYVAEILFPPPIARLSIYSEKAEFVDAFVSEHLTSPWGIAIHNDSLYVTDKKRHSVFHFKIAPGFKLVGKVGGLGAGVGFFSSPRQLAVSTNGNLFVADCTNHRVVILNSNLHYQQCIKHSSLMNRPRDVKLTPDEVYVLCARSRVFVFSYTGEIMRAMSLSFQINDPLFFCLDADNNIVVTNDRHKDVKIYSNKGKFLQALWKESVRGKVIDSPKGIALTKDKKLIVVSGSTKIKIQIFFDF